MRQASSSDQLDQQQHFNAYPEVNSFNLGQKRRGQDRNAGNFLLQEQQLDDFNHQLFNVESPPSGMNVGNADLNHMRFDLTDQTPD